MNRRLQHRTHNSQRKTLSIPLLGTVGAAGVERAFCHWAHQLVIAQRRGQPGPVRPSRFCVNCHGGDCGLVSDQHPCLFFHLADPCWTLIRASYRLQREARLQTCLPDPSALGTS